MADAAQVLQFAANGISFGAILALAAIGLSLVYGILKLSNFAHGDFLAFGAFAAFTAATLPFETAPNVARFAVHPGVGTLVVSFGSVFILAAGLDAAVARRLSWTERGVVGGYGAVTALMGVVVLIVGGTGTATTNLILVAAGLVAIGAMCLLMVGLEFLIWRPLRRRGATTNTLIIVSIGLSLILRNALQLKFGGGNHSFDRPGIPADSFFGVLFTDAQQFTLLAAVVIIGCVHVFLKYSRAGKAMRALSDNPELARVSGIDVDRMTVYVWVIAGTLVAIAGLLLTLVQNNLMNVNMGFSLLIAIFASVIVGGIGNPYGAMVGGFLVGLAMKTSGVWIGTRYELAAAFTLLIVVLVLRPQGILGAKG